VLQEASDLGISHFDSAPFYGFGLAEHWLGSALRGSRAHATTITTKIGLYPPGGRSRSFATVLVRKALGRILPGLSRPVMDWTIRQATISLHASLRALMRDHVDLLLLHEPTITMTIADDFLEWLERQRLDGLVRYWGIAGEELPCRPLLAANHRIADVIQTRDSLGTRQASFVNAIGRPLQFTYGYLGDGLAREQGRPASLVMSEALAINHSGCVLFSTRDIEHLRTLARVGADATT
jgi:aryl-alcohol dehydrogenase-like predicted oxidoreductase